MNFFFLIPRGGRAQEAVKRQGWGWRAGWRYRRSHGQSNPTLAKLGSGSPVPPSQRRPCEYNKVSVHLPGVTGRPEPEDEKPGLGARRLTLPGAAVLPASPLEPREHLVTKERRKFGSLTCLIKVIETMSQETMPWSMSSKKAVRVNASISL